MIPYLPFVLFCFFPPFFLLQIDTSPFRPSLLLLCVSITTVILYIQSLTSWFLFRTCIVFFYFYFNVFILFVVFVFIVPLRFFYSRFSCFVSVLVLSSFFFVFSSFYYYYTSSFLCFSIALFLCVFVVFLFLFLTLYASDLIAGCGSNVSSFPSSPTV
jgi:hypothetical protein